MCGRVFRGLSQNTGVTVDFRESGSGCSSTGRVEGPGATLSRVCATFTLPVRLERVSFERLWGAVAGVVSTDASACRSTFVNRDFSWWRVASRRRVRSSFAVPGWREGMFWRVSGPSPRV